MRIILVGFHITFLTGIEDYLSRKECPFLFIGKNVSDEYKAELCDTFNREDKYKVIVLDINEDL